ncbi:MAG: hypothetical protein ABIC95_05475 [archaeon]
MKASLLLSTIAIIFLIAATAVNAIDTAIYVEFPDGTTHTECVTALSGTSGYDLLQSSNLVVTWSAAGMYGRALCKLNNIGDEVSGTVCSWGSTPWTIFINQGSSWQLSPVGLDTPGDCWTGDYSSFAGKYCAREGDILGFKRTSFDTVSFTPSSVPAAVSFTDICSKLIISDIDVKVGGKKSSNLADGDKISRDAAPGDDIEFDITVKNLDQTLDMRDVQLTVTIKDIDDGDDLEEEAKEFDIRDGDDKSVSVDFTLPLIVEEDTYDVIILVEGQDEDGVDYSDEAVLTLEVNKDKHKVEIVRAAVEPASVRCGGTASLAFSIVNLGTEDEEDISFSVSAPSIDFLVSESGIELQADDVDDSITRRSYLIDTDMVDEDMTILFDIKVEYDKRETDSQSLMLSVTGCDEKDVIVPPSPKDPVTEKPKVEDTTVVTHPSTVPAIPVGDVVYAKSAKSSSFGEVLPLALLIAVDVVLILLVALLLSALFRRKN